MHLYVCISTLNQPKSHLENCIGYFSFAKHFSSFIPYVFSVFFLSYVFVRYDPFPLFNGFQIVLRRREYCIRILLTCVLCLSTWMSDRMNGMFTWFVYSVHCCYSAYFVTFPHLLTAILFYISIHLLRSPIISSYEPSNDMRIASTKYTHNAFNWAKWKID